MTTTKRMTYYRRPTSGSRFWNWTRKARKRATPLRRMKVETETEAVECTAMVVVGEAPMAVASYTMVGTEFVKMDEYYYLSDANVSEIHSLTG